MLAEIITFKLFMNACQLYGFTPSLFIQNAIVHTTMKAYTTNFPRLSPRF